MTEDMIVSGKSKSMEKLFYLGKIVGFLGLKGEVKVRPFSNSPELALRIKKVYLKTKEDSIEADVLSLRLEKRLYVMKLKGFPDRTSVELLMGLGVYCDRAQLSVLEEDQWWVQDLVGLEVFSDSGEKVGVVLSIIEAATDILEILPEPSKEPAVEEKKDKEKTILVPFVKALVPVVDLSARKIVVKNIPGLFEAQ